jgi:hypothetical protein
MKILKGLLETDPVKRLNLNDLLARLRKILNKKEIDFVGVKKQD